MLDLHSVFSVFRCDRKNGRLGGGSCALVPIGLKAVQVSYSLSEEKLLDSCCNCDVLTLDLNYNCNKVRFILIYRPPSTSGMESIALSNLVSSLYETGCTNVILGDLNLPEINWETLETKLDGVHDVMLDCFSSLGLNQFVNFPTRYSTSGRGNILDIILSNDPMFVDVLDNHPPLGTSDHAMIEFCLYFQTNTTTSDHGFDSTTLPVYDWSAADYDAINDHINNIDWHNLFGFNFTPDSLWSGFKSLIWPIIDVFVPKKMVHHWTKYRPRMYPKPIRNLLIRKKAIWRKLRSNYSAEVKTRYLQVSRECKNAILKFDTEREVKLLESNNLGAFYRFVNKNLSSKSGIAPLKNSDGKLFTDDGERATLLNEYFHSIFTKDNGNQPLFASRFKNSDQVTDSTAPTINDITISPSIISAILRKLKINSSPGPDQLPPILFNKTASSISYPLSILFRSVIDLHELPLEWKQSIVSPIFKKGSPSDPSNYRPISLTCTCCKILETIIASDLLTFLYKHRLLSKNQHGFLKKHSTITNIIESLNDWTVSLTNNRSVIVAYVDFRRAFDVISHTKLLQKLVSYGVDGNLLACIMAFLSNRTQCVRINNTLSTWLPVISGVPQGSVLGPLLFNLFINDLTDNFDPSISAKLFADDLKIYTEYSLALGNNFQKHLDIIHNWSDIWQLPISYSKCNIMELGKTASNTVFNFSKNDIAKLSVITDLGILFETNLKFQGHINLIITKANQRSFLISRSFLSKSRSNLTRAYKVYVRPLVEYASSVWSPTQINQIIALEKLQKKFTKRLPGLQSMPYKERLSALNLQTLEHRRLICDLVLCFTIVHGYSPLLFSDFFTLLANKVTRGHPLRISPPLLKSNFHKSSFRYRVVAPWNSLPESIVTAGNVGLFKRLVLKHDLSKFLIFSYT